MSDLIKRLEQATRPDARLDGDIHEALGRGYVLEENEAEAWFVKDKPSQVRQVRYAVPAYTASIDDALTLVPEGLKWSVGNRDRHAWGMKDDAADIYWADITSHKNIRVSSPEYVGIDAASRNPALALCIAALKARPR